MKRFLIAVGYCIFSFGYCDMSAAMNLSSCLGSEDTVLESDNGRVVRLAKQSLAEQSLMHYFGIFEYEENKAEALKLALEALKTDPEQSFLQFILAEMYRKGEAGLQQDIQKAIDCYVKSIEFPDDKNDVSHVILEDLFGYGYHSSWKGKDWARYELGNIYLNGLFGIEKNEALGIQYLENSEVFAAKILLGDYYFEKEPQKAKGLYYNALEWANPIGVDIYKRDRERKYGTCMMYMKGATAAGDS